MTSMFYLTLIATIALPECHVTLARITFTPQLLRLKNGNRYRPICIRIFYTVSGVSWCSGNNINFIYSIVFLMRKSPETGNTSPITRINNIWTNRFLFHRTRETSRCSTRFDRVQRTQPNKQTIKTFWNNIATFQ